MRSKADETFVIVETLICPLQISHDKKSSQQTKNKICFVLFKIEKVGETLMKGQIPKQLYLRSFLPSY